MRKTISYGYNEVVFIRYIATPDGEAKIVADDGKDTPAVEGEDGAVGSWMDKLFFASWSKKMTLRLELYASTWLYEEEDVMYIVRKETQVAPCKSHLIFGG